jgi:hypothetical protein
MIPKITERSFHKLPIIKPRRKKIDKSQRNIKFQFASQNPLMPNTNMGSFKNMVFPPKSKKQALCLGEKKVPKKYGSVVSY